MISPKTGIINTGREPVEYQSPKSDDLVEEWGRMKLGRTNRENHLLKRIAKMGGNCDGKTY